MKLNCLWNPWDNPDDQDDEGETCGVPDDKN